MILNIMGLSIVLILLVNNEKYCKKFASTSEIMLIDIDPAEIGKNIVVIILC